MAHVHKRITGLGAERVRKVLAVGREGGPDQISGSLLLAIGIRESGLMNVLGDDGWARGAFQIHARFHPEKLRGLPGCRAAATIAKHTSRCWVPVKGHTALDAGYAPTIEDGARVCVRILRDYLKQAGRSDIPIHDRLRVAIAAYNCGMGGALKGYRAGNVDMATTGADYSKDCLLRRTELNQWLHAHPKWMS